MAKRRSPATPASTRDSAPEKPPRSRKKPNVVSLDAAVTPKVSATPDPVAAPVVAPSVMLRQKEFLAAVAGRCDGLNRADLRRVMDATLTQLSEALTQGQTVNLPALGKARVVKTVERNGAPVLTMKFHPAAAKKTASPPLAKSED